MLNELSLFSGYGGFSLGLKLAGLDVRTVAYVEIDQYCQKLIQQRIKDGVLDDGPIYPDIRSFSGSQCRGLVDIITAGFPCQPHSVAGKRRGEADERNLWPDTLRVIRDVGPRWVVLENVPGILSNGYGGTVVGELAEIGYDCVWDLVPAEAVGAPHLRWRWWCLAIHDSEPSEVTGNTGPRAQNSEARTEQPEQSERSDSGTRRAPDVAYSESERTRELPIRQRGSFQGEADIDRGCDDVAEPQRFGCDREQIDKGQKSARRRGIVQSGNHIPDANQFHDDDGGYGTGQIRIGRSAATKVPGSVLGHSEINAEWAGLCPVETFRQRHQRFGATDWWETEPDVGRVANGVASRVDRLRAIGNGIVPEVVAMFLRGV